MTQRNLVTPAYSEKFASVPEYRKKFAQGPVVAYMFLPQTEPPCNSRCTGCYLLSGGAYEKRTVRTEEGIVVDILRLRKAGFSVFASTSEILLFRRWTEILDAASSTFVLTNGRILVEKPRLCDEIKNIGVRQMVITANFENSGLRLTPSAVACEAARRVVASGLELMMRVTVTPLNLQVVRQMAEGCISLGATVVQFLRYLRVNGDGPDMLSEQETARFFEILNEVRGLYPNIYLSASGSFGTNFRKKQFCCNAGSRREYFVIGVDDKIYPCIYLTQPENAIGRYEDGEPIIDREFVRDRYLLECPAYKYLKEKQKGGI